MFLQLLTGLSVLKVVLGARSCDRQYTLSSGTVTSQTSGYYSNNQNCQYDIQVNFGKGIKLTWSTFDIKGYMPNCNDDYVEIFIGCRRYSIGRYCNQNENNLNTPFDVYSPDNCLRIKFHSDGSTNGRGFKAYYSAFSLTAGTSGVGGSCSSTRSLSSSYGVISSQSWPRAYPSLKDCYWKIDVGRYKNIKIAFMDFNLESDKGVIMIKLK
ncbi:hypothetical protein OS493_027349 [Desmophyllum pertusum]|uniref:CUB domain-containing protein n=1 Tax=Desmophyllum pertusum TaxID=174260 RepID=A0A9X0CPT8_9CNID|nr:hypothetical protein OS493_027349 [Desmophyllum pertusum]